MKFKTWTALAVALFAISRAPQSRADAPEHDRVETLGPVPDNIHKEFVFGNGQSVAWLTDTPKGQILILNGHPDPLFSAIKSAPVVSPDGKRMAYKVDAEGGAKRAVVVDGKMGTVFETVNNDSIHFSPDSAILDYTAGDAGKTLLIRDGKVLAGGTEIRSDAITSRDFGHTAYKVAVGEGRAVVLDGRQGPVLPQIDNGSIAFDRSGSPLVYVASDSSGNKATVYINGVPENTYEQVSDLGFSPDGKHLVYIAKRAGKERVVYDDNPGPLYDAIDRYFLRFLPGGTVGYRAQLGNQMRLVLADAQVADADGILDWSAAADIAHGQSNAFIGRTENSWWIEFNGKKSQSYERVAAPVAISPDGKHFVYAAKQGSHWFLVLDDKVGAAWDRLAEPPVFSPDGQHWGCAVERGNQWFCIVDGKPYGPYDWFLWGAPQFSPDGGHFAFAAQLHGRWSVLLDGKPVAEGDDPGPPALRFSPDGLHFACALKDGGQWRMIVDGIPGPPFDRLFDRVPDFLPDGSLEYLAIRGKTLNRVTHY